MCLLSPRLTVIGFCRPISLIELAKSHLAGVGEDGRAVALNMLVEPDAGAGLA